MLTSPATAAHQPTSIWRWVSAMLPFAILAAAYVWLPERVIIQQSLTGEPRIWGPRSLRTVFRLPAMGVTLLAMTAILRHAVNQSPPDLQPRADRFWSVMQVSLLTKGFVESLAAASAAAFSLPWIKAAHGLTLFTVIAGLAVAAPYLPAVMTGTRTEGKRIHGLTRPQSAGLVGLVTLYAAFAIVPMWTYGP